MVHVLLILAIVCVCLAFAFTLGWWAALRSPNDDAMTVDLNSKCPACGHRSGKLRLVAVLANGKPEEAIQHTCQICGAQWHEPTVLKWVAREPVKLA